jgi:hypothetical protein
MAVQLPEARTPYAPTASRRAREQRHDAEDLERNDAAS